MQLTVTSIDSAFAAIRITGRVDQASVGRGAALLEPLGRKEYSHPIIVDLSGVEMIDSSGIGWLLACQKRCHNAGGKLILHSPPMLVRNVLKMLNLQRVLDIVDSAADAEKLAVAK